MAFGLFILVVQYIDNGGTNTFTLLYILHSFVEPILLRYTTLCMCTHIHDIYTNPVTDPYPDQNPTLPIIVSTYAISNPAFALTLPDFFWEKPLKNLWKASGDSRDDGGKFWYWELVYPA